MTLDTDIEGAYFIFSYEEVLLALKNNLNKKEILKVLEITQNGNFEGSIHINIYDTKRPEGFDKFNKKLKIIRKTKEYPFIDKKINTAWNAMMIEALFSAGIIDEKFIILANTHLDALKEMMFDKGELYHQTLIGTRPTQSGLLEDYSFLISALLAGYKASFEYEKFVIDTLESMNDRIQNKIF